MKRVPKTVVDKATARHRARLAKWLSEWMLDRAMRATSPDKPAAGMKQPGTLSERRNEASRSVPEAGQVILLPPVAAVFAEGRPLFVLTLRKAEDGFVVVPFSRFSTPATDREWKTGLRAKPLRVLCLWNARRVSAGALSNGWLTTRLSPLRHRQALAACEQFGKVAAKTGPAFGPPLLHPLDPRHVYLADEAALLDEHLAGLESRKRSAAEPFLYRQVQSQLLKAAEDRSEYGRPPGKRGKGRSGAST